MCDRAGEVCSIEGLLRRGMRLVCCLELSCRQDGTHGSGGVRVRVVLEVPAVAWSPTTDLSCTGTVCAPCAIMQVSGAVEKAAFVAGCDW